MNTKKRSDIVHDIIELKKKHNLVEDDATYNKLVEWYDYALSNGCIITEYDGDKLVGFLEYVRLSDVPKSLDHIDLDHDRIKTNDVLFVCNAISDSPKTLWKMKRGLFKVNHGFSHLVWHRKKNNCFVVFNGKDK